MIAVRLTEKGRDLARRLREALEARRAVREAWRPDMTIDERVEWLRREEESERNLEAVQAELETMLGLSPNA